MLKTNSLRDKYHFAKTSHIVKIYELIQARVGAISPQKKDAIRPFVIEEEIKVNKKETSEMSKPENLKKA